MKKIFLAYFFISHSALFAQDLQTILDSANIYWDQEQYQKSFDALTRGIEIAKKELEANTEFGRYNLAYIYNESGIKLYQYGDYATAETYYLGAAELFKEEQGESGENYLVTLENLTLLYEAWGKYDKSLETYFMLFENPAFLANAQDLYLSYNTAGLMALELNYLKKAIDFFQSSLSHIETSHPDYWVVLENTLIAAQSYGEGMTVEDHLNKFLQKFPERAEDYSNLIAYINREHAITKIEANNHFDAIPHLLKALEYNQLASEFDSTEYVYALQDLSSCYVLTSQYADGLPWVARSEVLCQNFYGEGSSTHLYTINQLALTYAELGHYQKAVKQYKRGIKYAKRADFEEAGTIKALLETNFTDLLIKLGRFEEAKTYNRNTVDFYEQDPLFEDDLIFSLNQTGMILVSIGEYEKAESLFGIILRKNRDKYGFENEMATKIASNMTALYIQTGRYSRAEKFMLFVLSNDLKNHGEESFEYSFSLQVAGTLLLSAGEYAEAVESFKKALEIREKMVGENNRELLLLRQALGTAYLKAGKLNEAKDLLLDIAELQVKNTGKQTLDLAMTQNDLGLVYYQLGNLEQAKELFTKAHSTRKKILGDQNQFTITSLYNLACTEYLTNNFNRSIDYFEQAVGHYIDVLNDYFPYLSEKERLEYYHTIKGQTEAYFSLLNEQIDQNPELAANLFNARIRTRDILLGQSMKLRNLLNNQDDPVVKLNYKKWLAIKQEAARLEQQAHSESQQAQIDSLKVVAEEIERSFGTLASQLDQTKPDWQEIANSLKEGEVVVEILRIVRFDFVKNQLVSDEKDYLALIIDNTTRNAPRYVRMKNGHELETKGYNLYKNNIKFKLTDKVSYNNFWKSMAEAVSGYEKIYLSSDGVYHLVNIQSLFNPETGNYVIEESRIESIGNSGGLLERKATTKSAQSATLFGFPDFNAVKDSEIEDHERTGTFREIFTQGVAKLPGTKVEVEGIDGLLQTAGIATSTYLSGQASEKQIKSLGPTDILHIATHGYFEESSSDLINDDPLLHSGLLLANLRESIAPNEENGIVSAKEVAQLDLHETELVVLSACETGRGKVVDGQGVYGLQRAFRVAGADHVIISLWKVDDEATKELMTLFYENYLKSGDPRAALKTAQIELKKTFPDPLYWGAFYVVGD